MPIARAQGVWLEDFEGRRILDAVSSWWVNLLHGHGQDRRHPRSGGTASGLLEHAMLAGFTHRPAVELAERLGEISPGRLGHASRVRRRVGNRDRAQDKLHAWRNAGRPAKRRFVSLAGSCHGETLGALSVTDVAIFRDT